MTKEIGKIFRYELNYELSVNEEKSCMMVGDILEFLEDELQAVKVTNKDATISFEDTCHRYTYSDIINFGVLLSELLNRNTVIID